MLNGHLGSAAYLNKDLELHLVDQSMLDEYLIQDRTTLQLNDCSEIQDEGFVCQKWLRQNPVKRAVWQKLYQISDVTMIQDSELISRIARAVYFPPINYAWTIFDGQKFIFVPASDLKNNFPARAVNSPNF
jgi:hypothetical protein